MHEYIEWLQKPEEGSHHVITSWRSISAIPASSRASCTPTSAPLNGSAILPPRSQYFSDLDVSNLSILMEKVTTRSSGGGSEQVEKERGGLAQESTRLERQVLGNQCLVWQQSGRQRHSKS